MIYLTKKTILWVKIFWGSSSPNSPLIVRAWYTLFGDRKKLVAVKKEAIYEAGVANGHGAEHWAWAGMGLKMDACDYDKCTIRRYKVITFMGSVVEKSMVDDSVIIEAAVYCHSFAILIKMPRKIMRFFSKLTFLESVPFVT